VRLFLNNKILKLSTRTNSLVPPYQVPRYQVRNHIDFSDPDPASIFYESGVNYMYGFEPKPYNYENRNMSCHTVLKLKIGTTFQILTTFLSFFGQVVEVTDPVEIENGLRILNRNSPA
jgi:hypothetical protein